MTMNRKEFELIDDILRDAGTIAVAGHVSPDGDCIGSALAVYHYLRKITDATVTLYLEPFKECYSILPGIENVKESGENDPDPDLLFLVDVSSVQRIGAVPHFYHTAGHVVCADHHVSNPGVGQENVIFPDASSTCEVLYGLMDPARIDRDIAVCLYTGIIHDSGLFQYSSTSPDTMRIAAKLMEKDIPFPEIVQLTFTNRTLTEQKLLGFVLQHAEIVLDGKAVFSYATRELLEEYGADKKDLDICVAQLRMTQGPECAIFLYPAEEGTYKASLRSKTSFDVSAIAVELGGGGHIHAAGCTLKGTLPDVREKVLSAFEKALADT